MVDSRTVTMDDSQLVLGSQVYANSHARHNQILAASLILGLWRARRRGLDNSDNAACAWLLLLHSIKHPP